MLGCLQTASGVLGGVVLLGVPKGSTNTLGQTDKDHNSAWQTELCKVRHPFSTSFFLFLSSLALKFKQTTTATKYTALKFYPQILTACPQNNRHRLVTA